MHRLLSPLARGALPLACLLALAGCEPKLEACVRGELGCSCRPPDRCDEGLDCLSNRCVEPQERSLTVQAVDARACELVVKDAQARVTGVTFGNLVQGSHRRRGDRTAVAFISTEDVPLTGGVTLRVVAEGEEGAPLELEEGRCFDRLGREIEGASVSL